MSARNIFGNSFTVNQEINIVGKKTELKSKGENWPNLTLGEVATPTNISAMIPAALGAIPTCSGSGRISQELMAVMGAVSTAGTVMVTQNQNTGQYTAEYILSLMKVMNGAYAKGGNLSEEKLKRLIMQTQDINEVYSWDDSIVYNKMMGIRDLGLGEYVPALAMSQSYFESWIKGDGKKRKPIGKVVYHFNKSGQIEVRSASPGDRIGVNYPISCESQN